ncbi:MAG: hypothetical protein KJ952_03430 [Candidatus Omnitrophica bacterium]|nr:hypothetical protein [Candidatus Omnitrophota bacterium]
MKNLKDGKRVIETRRGNRITMDELFRAKEEFHKASARLPFEEKIKILAKMREIVRLKH